MSKQAQPRALGEQRSQGGRAHAARQPAEAQPSRPAHPRQEGLEPRSPISNSRASASRTEVRKALELAIANAENNHDLDVDDLVVGEAYVGKAMVMKRFSPRARGRAGRIEKPFSNLTIIVREVAAKTADARPEEMSMGQKVNPIGLRLGVNRTWDSRWFSGKNEYGKLLHEDMKIRDVLMKNLKQAAISKIIIERPHKKCRVNIHSARPGVVIGKKGADIDKLRKLVAKLTDSEVAINIVEVRKPEVDATLVADSIAQQLERRVAFRRAMKRAVQSAMRLGAEGIRINCSGRLGGAEIARLEWYREGRVPLHTLRADVDYGVATAHTAYGTCGIKVWIFKGEILEHDPMAQDKKLAEADHSAAATVRAASASRAIATPPDHLKVSDHAAA